MESEVAGVAHFEQDIVRLDDTHLRLGLRAHSKPLIDVCEAGLARSLLAVKRLTYVRLAIQNELVEVEVLLGLAAVLEGNGCKVCAFPFCVCIWEEGSQNGPFGCLMPAA